jgi:molecular chaperone GrpE
MRPEEERQGPVIRDRRRIDPVTGQVRDTGEARPQAGPPAGGPSKTGSEPGGPRPGKDAGREPGSPASGATATAGPAPSQTPKQRGGAAAASESPVYADGAEGAADPGLAQAVTMLAERTADLQRLQAEYANYRKRVERDRLAVREQALANVLHGLLPVLDDIGRAQEHGELTGGFKSVADSLEGIVVKLGLTTFGEAGDPFDPTLHEALMHSYSADVTEPTAVQILQPGYKVGERIIRPARVAVAEPGVDDLAADSDEAGHTDQADNQAEPGSSADGEEPAE